MSLLNELKRRNVIRVAAGYIVVAWLVIQVAETILPFYGVSDATIRLLITVLAVLFIPVVIIAWVFEWTPEGIKVDEGGEQRGPTVAAAAKRWDRIVMIVLVLAVTFFIVEKLTEPATAIESKIVVLPFENRSSDPEQDYLSFGVSESVHGLLARVPELTVSVWPTTVELKSRGLSVSEIARTLEAPNLLEGSVQKSGNRVRVTARLVALASQSTLWSQSYDRDLDDILAIQDEIAADVVANLKVELLGELPKSRQSDSGAQLLVTQSWALLLDTLGTSDGGGKAKAAKALLEEALALDPDNVDALVASSFADYNLRLAGLISPEEEFRRWQEIKARVSSLDPEHGLFNAYRAWETAFFTRDLEQANEYLQLALRFGLNDLEALRVMESVARRTGHVDAAVELGRRSQAIDPTCTRCMWQFSESLFYAGRYEEALEAKKRLQLISLSAGGFHHRAIALIMLGRYEEAIELARREATQVDDAQKQAVLAMAAWSLGDLVTYDEQAERLQKADGAVQSMLLAEVYAWAGDKEKAFEQLNLAVNAGQNLRFQLFLPQWESLLDDPRWTKLREDLNWTEEQLSVFDFSVIHRGEQ